MRHLLAERTPRPCGRLSPLQHAAKVQKLFERCKSGAGAKHLRSGSQPNGNMIAISAVRMANCQRVEDPTMHKL